MENLADTLAAAKSHHNAGRLAEAEALYREIVRARPDHAEALFLLGVACDGQGRPVEAIAELERAIGLRPDLAEAHNYLGAVFAEQRRLDDAIKHFEHACRLRPESAEPSQNLCNALSDKHNERGLQLFHAGQLEAATEAFQQALEVKPDCFAACGNLGNLFLTTGNYDEAERCYRRVLAIEPNSAEAHYNLGQIAKNKVLLDQAVTHYRQALAIRPDYKEARFELAFALVQQNQLDAGAACYQEALALNLADADAHFGFGVTQLLRGRFAEGWPEYEWRFLRAGMAETPLAVPRWTGEPLAGKTILLRCEQGFGDALQFVRYAELVKRQGATVIVESRAPLASLLARASGVDRVVERGQPVPNLDYAVPLLSLPGLFGTTLETIPSRAAYLSADETLVARWGEALAAEEASMSRPFRVGIAWQGNPTHAGDPFRSMPLEHFAALARVPGVRLYSLQFGPGREQLATVAASWPVVDLADRLGDFHNTAAAISNLDLVITCDSSTAHLAGALGRPTWLALALVPDWRWLLDRNDSPWYPSMRLFRQLRVGSWQEPFAQIASALAQHVQARGPSKA